MVSDAKKPVVILGAGGYAGLVYEILRARSDLTVLGCTDKVMGLSERTLGDGISLRILGDDNILPDLAEKHSELQAVIALGPELMDARTRLINLLDDLRIKPATAAHPRAIISRLTKVGAGTVFGAGAVLSAGSHIGRHCVIQIGASVDHDARIGNNVYIGQGSRISSYVEIEDNVVVELGASINRQVKIGPGARVTGGAFVNTDVPDRAVVVGVPARVVRYLDSP